MKFFFIFLMSGLTSATVHAAPQYADCSAALSARDPILSDLTEAPTSTYARLRAAAKAAQARGEESFAFAPGRHTLGQIIADIQTRGAQHPALAALLPQAQQVLHARIPYHAFWRFVLRYVTTCDGIVREQHPELTSHYNESLAAHLFEPFLARWPDALLFPTFDAVDTTYFLKSKAVPIYLIGLTTEPAYADGYLLSPLEFFMHDLGHSDYMAARDLKILRDDSGHGALTPEQRTTQWWNTASHLLNALAPLQTRDPDLADAVHSLLFEILHERGFSYELSALLREVQTEKWTDVLQRKFQSVFYRGAKDLNPRQFARLRDARQWLEHQVRILAEAPWEAPLERARVSQGTLELTRAMPAEYFYGQFLSTRIAPDGDVQAQFSTAHGPRSSELYYNVSLAQVDALQPSPLTPTVVEHMERILAFGYPLQIGTDGRVTVLPAQERPAAEQRLTSLMLFKINQLLGLHSRGQDATFTAPYRDEIAIGTVVRLSGKPGERRVHLQTAHGLLTLPLAELTRIFP